MFGRDAGGDVSAASRCRPRPTSTATQQWQCGAWAVPFGMGDAVRSPGAASLFCNLTRVSIARAPTRADISPARPFVEDGFVIAAEIEIVAQLALDLLPQPVHRHPADEVGGKLAGALLGADDLQPGLAFRLETRVRPGARIASSSVMSAQCILWSRIALATARR